MTEYAVMPMEDWQDVVDATREKTATSDMMVSSEVGAKIRSIASGGGSSEDLSTELAAQEALLSSLGGALGALAPTITISFVSMEWGEYGEEYTPTTVSGSYSIDDGEVVSFDDAEHIVLPFVPLGKKITIYAELSNSTDETGCTAEFNYDKYAMDVTPTSENASVKLYYY